MANIIPLVQNADRVVHANEYDHDNKLLVTSMFVTLQGEGPYAGYPATFLRLAGCNFGDKQDHCSWCDSSFQFGQGVWYSPERLAVQLMLLPDFHPSQILVITGGEPTLQHALLHFINFVNQYFRRIQIETNGTQAAFFAEMYRQCPEPPYICVSPKASYKAGRYAELSPTVLKAADCLKFVVSADPESPHHTVPDWAFYHSRDTDCPLYVSPMAEYLRPYSGEVASIWTEGLIDKERTAANYAYAAKYAIDNHCLLSVQTHLFLGMP